MVGARIPGFLTDGMEVLLGRWRQSLVSSVNLWPVIPWPLRCCG